MKRTISRSSSPAWTPTTNSRLTHATSIYEVFWIWKDIHVPGGPLLGTPEFDPRTQRTMVLDGVGGHGHRARRAMGLPRLGLSRTTARGSCRRHAQPAQTMLIGAGRRRSQFPWTACSFFPRAASLPPTAGDVWRIDCSRFQKIGPDRKDSIHVQAGLGIATDTTIRTSRRSFRWSLSQTSLRLNVSPL